MGNKEITEYGKSVFGALGAGAISCFIMWFGSIDSLPNSCLLITIYGMVVMSICITDLCGSLEDVFKKERSSFEYFVLFIASPIITSLTVVKLLVEKMYC